MAARKKKRSSSKNSSFIKKGIVSGLLVAVVLSLGYELVALSHPGSQVLGTNSLLARGGNDEDEGRGEKSERQEVEIRKPDSGVGSGRVEQAEARRADTVELRKNAREEEEVDDDDSVELDEPENEVEDNDESEIEDVKIATDGGSFKVRGNHFGAKSHFPVSVNPATNELTITTPAGTKVVTVLPDKAVQNILTKGVLSKIGDTASSSAKPEDGDETSSESGEFSVSAPAEVALGTAETQNIELTTKDAKPVYKVKGVKNKKFLGFIAVSVEKTVTVSADTGEITDTNTSFFNTILNFLSF